ncbi:MAG: hypothetical protein U5K31_02720 [Balneolaceae bacterium]|nr:hypothetical protein [Balneolaceae bacterium]
MGLRRAVSEAINWFFKHEAAGIILEDDCVPDLTFYRFCGEMLQRYQDDERIMSISGVNFQPYRRTNYSYYFSRYLHCWGWATWAGAWSHFDRYLDHWPDLAVMSDRFDLPEERSYWNNIFNQVKKGNIDSWAYVWFYCMLRQNGLSIIPEVNLVSNIGFGSEGTHTLDSDDPWASRPLNSLKWPLKHPPSVVRSEKADRYTYRHHYSRSIWHRIKHRLATWLK